MAERLHDDDAREAERTTDARPAPRPSPQLAGIVGNHALSRALRPSRGLPSGAVSPELARLLSPQRSLGRDPVATQDPPATAPAASATTYRVGPNVYAEDQWSVAIVEVAGLWDKVGGVLDKRKDAVDEFAGSGGAGAAAGLSITDAILQAAITAVIAAATDGVGLVVAGALGKAVAGAAKRVSAEPKTVLAVSSQIVERALKEGKGAANKKIADALAAGPTPAPGGGRARATALARYASALDDTLEADGAASHAETLQRLLNQPTDPPAVKWAVADSLYQSLTTTLAACKEEQWRSTSDGWFGMQIESGAGRLRGYDTGIGVIEFTDDSYPSGEDSALGVKHGYLGGKGANAATVGDYNDRPLDTINLPLRLYMDNGSMGHGWMEIGWQAWKPIGSSVPTDVRGINRYGLSWLACKALGMRDIDEDDSRVNGENIARGLMMVWNEIKSKSVSQLGGSFEVMSMTSGVGASPF